MTAGSPFFRKPSDSVSEMEEKGDSCSQQVGGAAPVAAAARQDDDDSKSVSSVAGSNAAETPTPSLRIRTRSTLAGSSSASSE